MLLFLPFCRVSSKLIKSAQKVDTRRNKLRSLDPRQRLTIRLRGPKTLFKTFGAIVLYERTVHYIKAGVVCLQIKLCDPHLSALEVRFSRRGAIQIYVYVYLYLYIRSTWHCTAYERLNAVEVFVMCRHSLITRTRKKLQTCVKNVRNRP